MKKRNVLIHTAVASALLAMGLSAEAGSLNVTKRTVANESFGTAYTATTKVAVPNIAYVFNTPGGIVMNPSGQVTVKYVIAGGTWTSSAALAGTNVVVTSLPGGVTAGTPTINSAGDTVSVVLTNGSTNANATIGIGATVTLTNVSGATRFQAVGVVKGTAVTVSGSAWNTVADVVLESATAAKTVVDYAQAVTLGFTASTETKKIDLTLATPGAGLTAGVAGANLVQLGKITAENNPDVTPVDLDTDAALAETSIVAGAPAFNGAFTVTVAPATGAFTAKQAVKLFSNAACSVALTGGAATQAPLATAVVASTASVTLTGAGTAAQSATDLLAGVYVCSDYSGVTANAVLSALTPTISAVYTKASTTYTGDTLGNNTGYALTTNGQTVDVRSYIPAGTPGYTSYVRVINSGTVTAVVSAQWLYEDGTTGTAVALGSALAAGGAHTYTSTDIETAIGAPTSTIGQNRPRLRLTAPTSGLQAQSFFLNPGSSFATMHGAD